MTEASLIITNATIITMDPQQPRAEAVAVTDGKIVAVGNNSEISALAGDQTQRVDMRQGVLMPGFVEAHSHLLLMGMLLGPVMLDIRSFVAPTFGDVVTRLRDAVSAAPEGAPVLAFGFDTIAHDHDLFTRADLDEIGGDHPLAVVSLSAHTAIGNSVVLAIAGLTRDTPDPTGGKFGRLEGGELDGVAHEAPAVSALMLPMLGSLGFDLFASMRAQAGDLARAGYTTIGELLVQERDFPIIDALKAMPDFPVRMRLYEGTSPALKAHGSAGQTDPGIRQTGLKLWVDGTPLEGKSLHAEPFVESEVTHRMGLQPGSCGSANYSKEELFTVVRAYADTGLQFACHVQGDAGVDRILDVYETVLTERGMIGTDHRWRLEHCGAMTGEQFARATKLGVMCSMFAQHVYYFGDVLTDSILGEDRGAHWMRLKTAIDNGQAISLHNDGYFTPPEPIGSVATAVTRATKSGRILGADECISIDDAMKAITINAAVHLFSEHEVGSIEVGKLADFTELSADPYAVEPDRIRSDVEVLGTWINGHRVDLGAFVA